mmetsp:Transcript_15661/g.36020  ORF Transcript_15661/g.36020 Transcript_15661/m.36020 type:complete len:217 (-) Transcript_15661:528-1178(-)
MSAMAAAKFSFPSSSSVFTLLSFLESSFCLSSVKSNCVSQFSFLLSSSVCSFFKVATKSSMSPNTLSKLTFLPVRASAKKSTSGRCEPRTRASSANALDLRTEAVSANWIKLGLGRVFLKSSRASSSLRILMVSEIATSSSLRSFSIFSHSAFLVPQFFSRSARNALSSASASVVSSKSLPISAILTAMLPKRTDFSSIAFVLAAISFFLAATRAS